MTDVLWLQPDKPANISIGRARIAAGLRQRGYGVTATDERGSAARTLLRKSNDVLVTTTAAGGLVGPPTKLNGISFVVDYVDPITQMYDSASFHEAKVAELLQSAAFRAADGILYVYDEERERVRRYGAPATQTSLGVDVGRFAEPAGDSCRAARRLLDEHDTEPGFAVYIGGLEGIYDIPTLVEAAVLGEFPLVVAGVGEYERFVADAASLHDHITYLGTVDHDIIPGVLDYASVGLCLVDDPHTVKVLEYAASGLPIVHVDGRARSVLPARGVRFVSPDASAVAEAVNACRRDPPPTDDLEVHARQHEWERVVDDYARMIDRVQ